MSLEERVRAAVAALLRAAGESQTQLAAALGVSQGQVSRRQSGSSAWSLTDCEAVAAHYGIDVLELLAGPSRDTEGAPLRPRPPGQHPRSHSRRRRRAMTDFDALDALLTTAKRRVALPPIEERRTLREELNLSRTQLAQALGVSPSTVRGWEAGRDPSGEVRKKYAYFLDGVRTRLAAEESEAAEDPADGFARRPGRTRRAQYP
ncbi:helix-turn-helix domain-containing protein [Streptomyces chartreusis]